MSTQELIRLVNSADLSNATDRKMLSDALEESVSVLTVIDGLRDETIADTAWPGIASVWKQYVIDVLENGKPRLPQSMISKARQ